MLDVTVPASGPGNEQQEKKEEQKEEEHPPVLIDREESAVGEKKQGNTAVEEVSTEEEEKKKEQKESSFSGEVYTLERWHPSNLKDGAVCGYVFNNIDKENPVEDGSFHRISLDRMLNFDNLQEESVVSTIATKEGSSELHFPASHYITT